GTLPIAPHDMTSKPSAVIFDLGKVLVDFDYGLVVRRVAARSPVGLKTLERLIVESPILHAFERGGMTYSAFFTAVQAESKYEGTFDEFAHGFADIFTAIPPMIALHHE